MNGRGRRKGWPGAGFLRSRIFSGQGKCVGACQNDNELPDSINVFVCQGYGQGG